MLRPTPLLSALQEEIMTKEIELAAVQKDLDSLKEYQVSPQCGLAELKSFVALCEYPLNKTIPSMELLFNFGCNIERLAQD